MTLKKVFERGIRLMLVVSGFCLMNTFSSFSYTLLSNFATAQLSAPQLKLRKIKRGHFLRFKIIFYLATLQLTSFQPYSYSWTDQKRRLSDIRICSQWAQLSQWYHIKWKGEYIRLSTKYISTCQIWALLLSYNIYINIYSRSSR